MKPPRPSSRHSSPPATRLRVVADKLPPEPNEPAAVWIATHLLHPWPDNPRINQHVVPTIIGSIDEFGWGRTILARKANLEIIAGETAWKAAVAKKLPYVPVRLMDLNERQAHKLAIADNRIGELADWEMAPLMKLLKQLDTTETQKLGWSDEEMKKLKAAIESEPPPPAIEDDAPRRSTDSIVTQDGDLWRLGKHRLVCGDSMDPKQVALACGDLRPFLCVTAPPVDLDIAKALELFTGDVAYVWCLQNVSDAERLLERAGFECRTQIIWRKPSHVLGRGHYQWQHESCWYAVRKGQPAKWAGGRNQSTVWDIAGLGAFGGSSNELDASSGHSSQKPVECFMRPMRNHGEARGVVYDPFAGSGTAIISAEQAERTCVAIELDPTSCDTIVERWQRLTGGKAKRSVG